jgi:hypothetical protein
MQTPKLELGQTNRKRGRVEIVLNGSMMRRPVSTPITYERDEDDFGSSNVDNLWGRVGQDRTPTVDLFMDAGKAIIHRLRSNEDVFKIHVPAFGERILVYASPSLIDSGWPQQLLKELQEVADNPGFSFEETAKAGAGRSGARAGMAGAGRSSGRS